MAREPCPTQLVSDAEIANITGIQLIEQGRELLYSLSKNQEKVASRKLVQAKALLKTVQEFVTVINYNKQNKNKKENYNKQYYNVSICLNSSLVLGGVQSFMFSVINFTLFIFLTFALLYFMYMYMDVLCLK